MNFITLTGYYPEQYQIAIDPRAIVAFSPTVINPKSKGSTLHLSGVTAPFQVLESFDEISGLLGIGKEKRG